MSKSSLSIVKPHVYEHDIRSRLHIGVVSGRQTYDRIAQIVHSVRSASGKGATDEVTHFSEDALLAGFGASAAPDVLIVDVLDEADALLDALENLLQQYPQCQCLVLRGEQSPDFLIRAMRAGVREVLSPPLDGTSLQEALDRIRRKMRLPDSAQGKVLAFVSCKGGSGATFLAANLAYALASHSNKRVALLDFNLQFGDALMFLSDQTPPSTLSDVARDIHRLDAAFLSASMLRITPNLAVLASPEDPADGMEVQPQHVEAILQLARQHYDFVVLDAGRMLNAPVLKALDHADTIFTVLQSTLPFIRDGRRLFDVFHTLDYPATKVGLIVNRHEKSEAIGLDALEQTLGVKVLRTIPNHYEVAAASVNQGIPIIRLARSSPISKGLLNWAEAHAGQPAAQANRWISRVFKRA